MKDIIVEFSGWVRMSPDKVTFVNVDTNEKINGEAWQKLSPDDRCDYILEDVITVQRDAEDGEYDNIDAFLLNR